MSKDQSFPPAFDSGPDYLEPARDDPPVSVSMAQGEARTEDRTGLGGRTLLSRPPEPQGRRSLFRR